MAVCGQAGATQCTTGHHSPAAVRSYGWWPRSPEKRIRWSARRRRWSLDQLGQWLPSTVLPGESGAAALPLRHRRRRVCSTPVDGRTSGASRATATKRRRASLATVDGVLVVLRCAAWRAFAELCEAEDTVVPARHILPRLHFLPPRERDRALRVMSATGLLPTAQDAPAARAAVLTAVRQALASDAYTAVQMLCSAHKSTMATPEVAVDLLIEAVTHGSRSSLRVLRSFVPADLELDKWVLLAAVQHGDPGVLEILANDYGANVTSDTLLLVAAAEGHVAVFLYLLRRWEARHLDNPAVLRSCLHILQRRQETARTTDRHGRGPFTTMAQQLVRHEGVSPPSRSLLEAEFPALLGVPVTAASIATPPGPASTRTTENSLPPPLSPASSPPSGGVADLCAALRANTDQFMQGLEPV